jgi:hypothetical protein
MVGDRDGGHPQLAHLRDQRGELDRAVQQAVLGVQVEVDEVSHSHSIVLGGFEETS